MGAFLSFSLKAAEAVPRERIWESLLARVSSPRTAAVDNTPSWRAIPAEDSRSSEEVRADETEVLTSSGELAEETDSWHPCKIEDTEARNHSETEAQPRLIRVCSSRDFIVLWGNVTEVERSEANSLDTVGADNRKSGEDTL